ncbi:MULTISPECIES: proline racemase family protein [unclassified Shinella]|uniref:proline racemase family protein n=1 Tax=Shinella sp. TaxID=1870904 RepID=UPI00234F1C8D|nr:MULTISPECIES: proline racemase family protein [unclassified Shinella]MCO5141126.1 proline racemase family protein [Shinella sp.]MDC7259985.1 proline racemase family protein [Shinella sp. YE25]
MTFDKALDILLVHCQGESGNVLVDGAPDIPGATILDKMNHLNEVDPSLRLFLTREPRAQVVHTTNLLLPPARSDADAAFIVLQPDRAHPMSGSNCICVVTALLETGRVAMTEPETVVRLDTAAGLIVARARCENGRCLSVSLDNVPAFVQQLDIVIDTPKWGRITGDIAFGGVFYAQIDVGRVGLRIVPEAARALAEAGTEIKALLARQVAVNHPEIPGLTEIAYVMFRDYQPDGSVVTCTTLKPGRVDRSPCGTGSSANLAILHARGQAKTGDKRVSRSIIGGTFTAEILGETTVAGRVAVLPRITGQGYVFGRQQLRLDAQDPFARGFAMSDTWGPQVGEL